MAILSLENIYKAFDGRVALDRINIDFPKGEIIGLVGPNGSGKTTVFNILTGVTAPNSGSIRIADRNLKKIRPYDSANLGLLRAFQGARLFEQLSVEDNILIALSSRRVFKSLFESTKKNQALCHDILREVFLFDERYKLAEELSYGKRKLLEIGRTMALAEYIKNANQEAIFLFDEPFAGLFPLAVKAISDIVKKLKDIGHTIILVEHNLDIIKKICSQVFVMNAGQLIARGKPEEVFKYENVVDAYIGG